MGILLLPILVFLYQKIAVIPTMLLAGTGVYLSRVPIHCVQYGFAAHTLVDFFPELIFYYVYGSLFHFYFHRHDFKLPHHNCYIALFFMDYLANFTELICRLQLNAFAMSLQINILLVALARTVILWAMVTRLSQYKFLLISTEHALRYQRLILLISKLNSEVIWMHKNTTMIEDAMAKSYRLFSQLQESSADPDLTQNALTVAKDTTICSSQKRIFHIYPNPFLWKSFPLFPSVNIHTFFDFGQTMVTEQKMLSSGSIFFRRKQRRERL